MSLRMCCYCFLQKRSLAPDEIDGKFRFMPLERNLFTFISLFLDMNHIIYKHVSML